MKKILYVEDDEDTAEAVKIILDREGYDINLAKSGKDALLKVVTKKDSFDLIMLDIMLPDMNGWQILKKFQDAKIKTNFIMLSSVPLSSVGRERLRILGVQDYIMKPFERDDLVERVKSVFNVYKP